MPRLAEVRAFAVAVAEARGRARGRRAAGAVVDQRLGGRPSRRRAAPRPAAFGGLGGVREALPSWTVRTASGSLRSRKDSQTSVPFVDAVLLLGGQQRERVVDLAAARRSRRGAPMTEASATRSVILKWLDGAGVGDGVLVAGEDVLAGEVAAAVGGVDVGVDAGDVGVGVGEGLLAAGAVGGDGVVDLGLEVGLGVRGVAPELLLQALVGGGAAREGGQLAAADVPEDVHQPQPVLGRRVAGAELGAVSGGAGDVRHARLLVADDRHVGAARGTQVEATWSEGTPNDASLKNVLMVALVSAG